MASAVSVGLILRKARRRNLPMHCWVSLRCYPELPLDIQHFHWKPPFVTRRNTAVRPQAANWPAEQVTNAASASRNIVSRYPPRGLRSAASVSRARPRERTSFSSPPVPCSKKQRVARSARHELVDKVQDCLFAQGLAGRTTGGRTSSICARAFSIHGGRRSLLPSSSIVSSAVNPGGSVAISKRMPPGSRK